MTEPLATSTDDTPSSQRWLHQAVAGAGLRAGLAVLGLAPAGLALAVEIGLQFELLQIAVGLFVYAACLFALERRDAPWPMVVARLAAGGLLGALLGWLAGASVRFAGEPWRAWENVADAWSHLRWLELSLMGLGITLVTQLVGAWFHVRTRTDRTLPQVICGLVLTGLGAGFFVVVEYRVDAEEAAGCLAALASGALVPLLVATGERRLVHARVDPQAPRATRGEVRPIIAGGALVVLTILALFGGVMEAFDGRRRSVGDQAYSVGALKTFNTAQTLFREGDKDDDGQLQYAASTLELADATLIDSILGGGVKQGYVFRVLHSTSTPEFLWIAAADPIGPGDARGDRRFVTNHTGVIYYRELREGPPVALDWERCEVPEGWRPVGR